MRKIKFLLSLMAILSLFVLGCTSKAPEAVSQPAAQLPAIDEPAGEEVVVEEKASPAEEIEESAEVSNNIIEITSAGFSPKTLTIQSGETVAFVNKDSDGHWPASNMHPTHTTYPGSSIDKCGTADESSIFDACKALAEGEEYSFTFTRTGRWPFHDHRNPGKGGTVVVE